MQILQGCSEIHRTIDKARAEGKRISFVPTMGNLHEGHLQLIRLAHQHSDFVVASIFVNAMQFALNEDYDHYPRTYDEDVKKLADENTHLLFYPTEAEIYPNGMEAQTQVIVPGLSDILCGASRPGHFLGVTTIVAKLFNIVQPDCAVFGVKDYQQLALIQRMVNDLRIPIDIIRAPVARDTDGLALSSRNGYLTPEERSIAPNLYRILCDVKKAIEQGDSNFTQLEQQATDQLNSCGMKSDYVAIHHAKTLEGAVADDTELVILGAAYLGQARLIDNVTLSLK